MKRIANIALSVLCGPAALPEAVAAVGILV